MVVLSKTRQFYTLTVFHWGFIVGFVQMFKIIANVEGIRVECLKENVIML